MKSIKRSSPVQWIILALLLLVAVCSDLGVKSHRAQARSTPNRKISPSLRKQLRQGQTATRVTAIIQSKGEWSSELDTLLQSEGALVTRQFKHLNARTVSMPARAVEALAARSDVRYISLDSKIQSFGHLSTTTGADAIRIQTTLPPGDTTTTTPASTSLRTALQTGSFL